MSGARPHVGGGRSAPGLAELTLPQMLREQAAPAGRAGLAPEATLASGSPVAGRNTGGAPAASAWLRALGLAPGGRVAIVSENRIEWLLTQMGAGAVGAVAVGVYATSPAEEMGYVLEHADIELVVCEDQSRSTRCCRSPTACRACAASS